MGDAAAAAAVAAGDAVAAAGDAVAAIEAAHVLTAAAAHPEG